MVTFQEMKKGTVLDLQFLPIFQLHLHTPDQTKISKQLLVLFFLKKLKIFNIHHLKKKTLIPQTTL